MSKFKQLLMAATGRIYHQFLRYYLISIFAYLLFLHKAQCCSFVPPRCLQHNTGRHLPEEDWCKFFFAPLFRLHTVHCTHSSLQSHSIRHAQHLDWDLKDNCSNEVGKFCTSILITLPIIQLLCYSDWLIDWLTEWPTDRLIGWLKVRIHGAILRAMAELHRVSTPNLVRAILQP